jgi:hypothetical protein
VTKTAAGEDIDSWCTKCKMDLMHRIVAMVGTTPKRVLCLTCDSEHNYRAPKTGPAAAVKKKRVTKKKATKTLGVRAAQKEQHWQELVGDRVDATFRRYNISTTFKEGDCIDHPKFGPGAVVALVPPGKISVVFRDGDRLLVHDRS